MNYYFLKTDDGRYLQVNFNARTGQMEFWLDTGRGCTPCFDTRNDAIDYRHQVRCSNWDLGISLEVSAEDLRFI